MRILCCLNRDLASSLALNLLLSQIAEHEVRIAITEGVGGTSPGEPEQRRELRIAEQVIPNQLFAPLIEKARLDPDNGRFLTFSEVQEFRRVPVHVIQKPNEGSGLQFIRAFAPDIIVSIRYGAILKEPVLSVPRLGILNLHSGLLPRYRGVLATFRALLNGDAEIGCTLHYIDDSRIDTGDIVSTCRVPVIAGQSLLRHVLRLYPPGVATLCATLRSLAAGEPIPRRRQQPDEGNYFSYPTTEEWREFCRRGWAVALPSDLQDALSRYIGPDGIGSV
jgi:methionyl-tRNA formyltransferase